MFEHNLLGCRICLHQKVTMNKLSYSLINSPITYFYLINYSGPKTMVLGEAWIHQIIASLHFKFLRSTADATTLSLKKEQKVSSFSSLRTSCITSWWKLDNNLLWRWKAQKIWSPDILLGSFILSQNKLLIQTFKPCMEAVVSGQGR